MSVKTFKSEFENLQQVKGCKVKSLAIYKRSYTDSNTKEKLKRVTLRITCEDDVKYYIWIPNDLQKDFEPHVGKSDKKTEKALDSLFETVIPFYTGTFVNAEGITLLNFILIQKAIEW